MFLLTILVVGFITVLVALIMWVLGDAHERKQLAKLETARLTNELLAQNIKLESYYNEGLKEEQERLENKLSELDENMLPTQEQLDMLAFKLKAENKLTNAQYNNIASVFYSEGGGK